MVTDQPFCEGSVDGSGTASHPGFHLAGFPAKLLPAVKVLSIRNHQYRRGIGYIAVHHVLGRVSEECRQGIELALGDGIELVVVASGASDGESEENHAGGIGSILGIDGFVFFRNDPAFVGGDVTPMKAGGHQPIQVRVRQQVPGDLLDRKLVEGLVPVEGPDHPIAIGPHLSIVVDVDTVGVSIARRVQPVAGPMFSPVPRLQQVVHQVLIGLTGVVAQKTVQGSGVRRQPGQVQGDTASQGAFIGFRRRRQPHCFQPGQNEPVQRVANPGFVFHRGRFAPPNGLEGPVLIPGSSFLDPLSEPLDLFGL